MNLKQLQISTVEVSFNGRSLKIEECDACAMSKMKQRIIRNRAKVFKIRYAFEKINVEIFSYDESILTQRYVLIIDDTIPAYVIVYKFKKK